jgi:hypothetical protein
MPALTVQGLRGRLPCLRQRCRDCVDGYHACVNGAGIAWVVTLLAKMVTRQLALQVSASGSPFAAYACFLVGIQLCQAGKNQDIVVSSLSIEGEIDR